MQQTEKYWDLILRILIGVIFLMGLGGGLLAFIPKAKELNTCKATSAALEQKINHVEAESKALQEKQNRFKTDPIFVEKIAHEIGYAHTNELIYQFPEQPETTPSLHP